MPINQTRKTFLQKFIDFLKDFALIYLKFALTAFVIYIVFYYYDYYFGFDNTS